jgi:hypothetical protein
MEQGLFVFVLRSRLGETQLQMRDNGSFVDEVAVSSYELKTLEEELNFQHNFPISQDD